MLIWERELLVSTEMKRGTVYLEAHNADWEIKAEETIKVIKEILADQASAVEHIGSTAIKSIKAKPIIDIVVGVSDYEGILAKKDELERAGIVFRMDERPEQLLFVVGDFENDSRSHHIHVVIYRSPEWNNYINFRDFLNADETAAKEYEKVKEDLAARHANDREAYTEGKREVIYRLLTEAKAWRETVTSNKHDE